MAWADVIDDPSLRVFYYIQIAGLPYYFTTFDPTNADRATTPWTAGDYTWLEALKSKTINSTKSMINRRTGITSSGSFNFSLDETEAGDLASIFAFYLDLSKRANISSDVETLAGGIVLDVTSTDAFTLSPSGTGVYLYIGNETVKYDSATNLGPNATTDTITLNASGRGQFGSDEAYYYVPTIEDPSGNAIGPEISTSPTTFRNRKISVYMNVLDENGDPVDSGTGGDNEKLIFKGFIREMDHTNGGKNWRFTCNDPLILLQRNFSGSSHEGTLRNDVMYSPASTEYTSRFEVWSTDWSSKDGVTITGLSTDQDKEYPFSVVSLTGVSVDVVDLGKSPFLELNISYSSEQTITKKILVDLFASALNGVVFTPGGDPGVNLEIRTAADGNLTAGIGPGYYSLNFINTGTNFRYAVWSMAFGTDDPQIFVDRSQGNLTQSNDKQFTASAPPLDLYTGTRPPSKTFHTLEKGIVWAGTGVTTSSSDATKYVLINGKELVKVDSVATVGDYDVNVISERNVREKSETQIVDKVGEMTAKQILYYADDNIFQILLEGMLSFGGNGHNDATYDVLSRGMGAAIPVEYVDVAAFESLRTDYEETGGSREYLFDKPISLKKILEDESKTLGFYVYLNDDFQISVKTLDITKQDDTAKTIDHTNMLNKSADLNLNLSSLVNQVEFQTKYKIGENTFNEAITVNNVESQGRYQEIRSVKIKNKAIRIPEDATSAESYIKELANDFLKQFSDPYPFIVVTCDRTLFGVKVGDLIKFTHNTLPHPRTGTAGFTDEWALVVGVERNFNSMETTLTITLNDFKGAQQGVLCPSMKVASGGVSGSDVTVEQHEFSNSGANKDIQSFRIGDILRNYDPATGAFGSTMEITALSTSTDTFTVNSIGSTAAGDFIEYAVYDETSPNAPTARQLLHTFFAKYNNLKIGTADAEGFIFL